MFLLVPAHLGSSRQRAVKWLCVCVAAFDSKAAYNTDRCSMVHPVGLLLTIMCPADTADVIEMLFWLVSGMHQRNDVLDGGPDPFTSRGNFQETCQPVTGPAKVAELIEMPFGVQTRVGPKNPVMVGACTLALSGKCS